MEMLSLIQKKHRSGLEQIPVLHRAQHIWIIAVPSWIFLILLLYKI